MRTVNILVLLMVVMACPLIVAAQQTIFVPDCNGNAAHDTTAFTNIKTTVGSTNDVTIRVPYKSDTSQRCTLNTITLTSNITLDNSDGSGIYVATGQTLTVAGPRVNPIGRTMFFGTGTTVLTGATYGSSNDSRLPSTDEKAALVGTSGTPSASNTYVTNSDSRLGGGGGGGGYTFTGFANPTASVGLTAINGAATTAMRSDAAPPLNVSISPTWTGTHTFGASKLLATSPIFSVNITDPLVIGGTGTTSSLALRSTSGTGTTGADIIFQTGNNGATEAARILNSGNLGIGTSLARRPLDVLSTSQPQVRLSYTDNSVYTDLQVSSAGNLTLTPTGPLFNIASTVRTQSGNYASQTTGWAIDGPTGGADFRYLFVDELHAKAFIADLEQALAGGQIITKSVSKVAADFTLPTAGNNGSVNVEEFAGSTARVFVDGDLVQLRQITRGADTSLTIASAYGTVSYVSRTAASGTTPAYQTYLYNRPVSNGGSASGTINAGTLALDYGTTVNKWGYWEVNAVDGANAANSPYAQVVTSSGAGGPAVQANRTVRTRVGNLNGITGVTEYGLYAGNVVDGTTLASTHRYLRLTDSNFELNNLDLNIYNSGNKVIALNYATPYFSLGATAPTSYLGADGFWVGNASGTYKMHLGTVSGAALVKGFSWDGSNLVIKGTNTTLDASGNLTATSATLSGAITATSGAIGGFNIGSDYVRDAANSFGLASTVTGGDDVRFWAGDTFANRATAPFHLTEAGVLTATNATVTGSFSAGAGNVVLNASGLNIKEGNTTVNKITWSTGGDAATASISNLSAGVTRSLQMFVNGNGTVADGVAQFTVGNGANHSLLFYLQSDQTGTDQQYASITTAGGTFKGFLIGNSGIPNAMLDVRGSAAVTGDTKTASFTLTAMADSATAPTVSSGFGTSPSIAAKNGTAAFTVNVGTGGTATGGVIGMPTAATGWACNVTNRTGVAANRADQHTVQTASSTTSVTVQNQTVSTGAALAWTASDVLVLQCRAY